MRSRLLALLLAVAMPVDALVLCQKGQRFTVRAQDCTKKERALALVPDASPAAILAGLTGIDGTGSGLDADTMRGRTPAALVPQLVDVNGVPIGSLISLTEASVAALRRVGDSGVILVAFPDGFVDPEMDGFYFAGPYCTGQRYQAAVLSPFLYFVLGQVVGTTLYYPTATTATATPYGSSAGKKLSCSLPDIVTSEGLCCHTGLFSTQLVPVASAPLDVAPPFRVVLP